MSFLLPAGLSKETADELQRTCIAGGPDNMPWPTEAHVEPGRLTLTRDVEESGCVVAAWEVDDVGRIMGSTATLIERNQPYHFQVEMARGKVNQLRCQSSDWQTGGLQLSKDVAEEIRLASITFGKAVTNASTEEAGKLAQTALQMGYSASNHLVDQYVEQMFAARHSRQPRLDTNLGCRLSAVDLIGAKADGLARACNNVCLQFCWSEVEPVESAYNWEPYDALFAWAEGQGLNVVAGPLIDFSPGQLPDWLWLWERDLSSLASFMCDYVETAVKRYKGRIKNWQLTNGSNCSSVLALGEDELLWLTVRLAEAARQVDPKLELVVGIAQPWGEYMATEDRTHSPFIFADTLIRSGLNLAALDIEMVMGVSPRGSYCRDALDASRLIDLYTLLGLPLRVTMGYPSADDNDPNSSPEYRVAAGNLRGGYDLEPQADWASTYAALALCKPSVRSVQWAHLTDAEPHQYPHCGLFDLHDDAKPSLQRLIELRENHLR